MDTAAGTAAPLTAAQLQSVAGSSRVGLAGRVPVPREWGEPRSGNKCEKINPRKRCMKARKFHKVLRVV